MVLSWKKKKKDKIKFKSPVLLLNKDMSKFILEAKIPRKKINCNECYGN